MRKGAFRLCGMVVLPVSAMLLASCISIKNGGTADITFVGSQPDTITVVAPHRTYEHQPLPATIQMKRKDLNKPVSFQSESHRYGDIIPGKKTDGTAWLQALVPIAGEAGLIIDAINGNLDRPRQSVYHLQSANVDDTTRELPVQDYSRPSLFQRHPKHLFRHEIGMQVCGEPDAGMHRYNKTTDYLSDKYKMSTVGVCGKVFNSLGIGAHYFYHFNHRIAVGALFGWVYQNDDLSADEYAGPNEQKEPLSSANISNRAFYVMPAMKYTWGYTPHINFYSKAGLGIYRQHLTLEGDGFPANEQKNEIRWRMAGQISPFGVEFGRGMFRMFTEVGYGAEGIIKMGFSLRLGKVK